MGPAAPRVGFIALALVACMGLSLWNFHDESLSWKSAGIDPLEDPSNVQIVEHSTTGASGPTAHAIFAADKATDHFCMTMKIAIAEGWQPVVVNWAYQPKLSFQKAKIAGWKDYLSTSVIPDDDIIFLLDSFDLWLQVGPQEAVKRYLAMESRYGRGPVLVSAEKNCWPFQAGDEICYKQANSSLPEDAYGPTTDQKPETSRPRYLNSGTFIGRKRDILHVLALIQARLEDGEQYFDDQHVAALLYVEEGDRLFRLDYEQNMAMTMHLAVDDIVWMPDKSVIGDGKMRGWNLFSGTMPVLIHWNGAAKGPMEETFRSIHPLYKEELDDDQAFTIQDGKRLSFNSICRALRL